MLSPRRTPDGDHMIPLACPHDDHHLTRTCGAHWYACPHCGRRYVVSITDAHATSGWDRSAPGAGAVLAVMNAEDADRHSRAIAAVA